jgi:hypothetical protein
MLCSALLCSLLFCSARLFLSFAAQKSILPVILFEFIAFTTKIIESAAAGFEPA